MLVIEGGDTKAAFAAFVFMYVSNHLIYLEYLRGRQFTPDRGAMRVGPSAGARASASSGAWSPTVHDGESSTRS